MQNMFYVPACCVEIALIIPNNFLCIWS